MGPRSFKRGNDEGDVWHDEAVWPLQWGRALSSAETPPTTTDYSADVYHLDFERQGLAPQNLC